MSTQNSGSPTARAGGTEYKSKQVNAEGAEHTDGTEAAAAAPANGTKRRRPPAAVAGIVLVPILVAVMLTLFAWPAARLAPHELPIGVAGPAQVVGGIEQGLTNAAGEDAFDVHTYPDEAAARAAIQSREVYGAIVAGPGGVTLLTASGASPFVAQLLQQAGTQLAESNPGAPAPQVVDVVPADPDDPRGAVLGSSLLPLVFAGMLAAFLISLGSRPGLGQALALIVVAALAGLVVVGIAQGWLSAFGGDWWTNAGVFALTILAIGAGVAGLGAVFGRVGLGLGAATMMLVGNPFSGLTSAPEMLPTWAGVIGQYLPPGAGGTLLRSTAFFDGAGGERPLLVLACWSVAGLLLVVIGRWVRRTPVANPA